jgi:hypothetical protein
VDEECESRRSFLRQLHLSLTLQGTSSEGFHEVLGFGADQVLVDFELLALATDIQGDNLSVEHPVYKLAGVPRASEIKNKHTCRL